GGAGSGNGLTKGNVEIIAIMEIGASGAERQVAQNLALRGLSRDAIAGFVAYSAKRTAGRIGDVAEGVRCVKAAGVNGIDNYTGTIRAIDQVHSFGEQRGKNKTGRDKHQLSLSWHPSQAAKGFFHMSISKFGAVVTSRQGVHGLRGCKSLGLRSFCLVAAEGALNGVL